MLNRVCKKCGEEKAIEAFPIHTPATGARRHECQACYDNRMKAWYKGNQDRVLQHRATEYAKRKFRVWTEEEKARKREVSNRRGETLRDVVYTAYGSVCACCGEDEVNFLTVDHVNNDGNEGRKVHGTGASFYRWIIKQGYPTDLQLLCYNCNIGKARNGGVCPHVSSEGSTTRVSARTEQAIGSGSVQPVRNANGDDIVSSAVKAVAAMSFEG